MLSTEAGAKDDIPPVLATKLCAPVTGSHMDDDAGEEVVISAVAENGSTCSETLKVCEIDFAVRRSLLRYKCNRCGRECPSKHKLKRHLSTHSNARPFPCKICGRSFKWSEYLQKHMRQQHPNGKSDSLSCHNQF